MHHEFTEMMPHKTFKKLKSTTPVVVETVNVAMQFQSAHKDNICTQIWHSVVIIKNGFKWIIYW